LIDYKDVPRFKPDFLFIDLDKNNFKNGRSFKLALSKTLKNINEQLDGYPTVIDTGGGYHIYQPVFCPTALENVTEFQKFDNVSVEFLRFAKNNLSKGKADKNNNPSFKSCLLRVPGSMNSKYNRQVTIVQKWNGVRSSLPREFMEEFRTFLIQKKIDDYNYRQKISKSRRYTNNDNNIIFWIEKLLNKPIADFRKNSASLILAPYLVNIKKLSYQESFDDLTQWLQKCDSIRKLDFNPKYLVKSALNIALQKRIPPMKLETLKNKNLELYHILQKQ
jgi:hypothetical protein